MSEEYHQLWCPVCQSMTEHEDRQCMREHLGDNDELLDDIEIIIEEDGDE